MSRRTFYDILNNMNFSVEREYDTLMTLFYREHNILYGGQVYTVCRYIDYKYFRTLPATIRGTFISVEDLMCAIGIPMETNDIDELYVFCELVSAITPSKYVDSCTGFEKQIKLFFSCVDTILEKTNHEWKKLPNGKKIIVEKNKKATQAAEIVTDDTIAIELIEYNHFALKGNIEGKRKILKSLADYLEPILKSRVLEKAGYKQLQSDMGFLLNNFHIRHNNKEGAKSQEYILQLPDSELEEWYDKIYNAALSVIIINEHISTQEKVAEIKSSYTWKT